MICLSDMQPITIPAHLAANTEMRLQYKVFAAILLEKAGPAGKPGDEVKLGVREFEIRTGMHRRNLDHFTKVLSGYDYIRSYTPRLRFRHITLLPKMYEAVGAGKPRLLMSVKKAETKLKQRMEIVGTKQDIEKKQLAEYA